jgi:hypothetical protein
MISHLKKTVFHLGSGWIWKRSARKNLVASQAHKGWRDRIRTRLNYAIAHELARWWLVEPKNMASNMVILYNATYLYIHCTCIISGFKRQWLYIDFKSAAGCSSTADDEPQWWLMFLDGFKTHTFWVKCPKNTCFQTVILCHPGHPERWFLALSFSICTWQVDPNWSKLMFFEIRLPPSILPRPHGTTGQTTKMK